MPASPHFKRAQRPAQGGFALVIALSLMAFVLLLLLSITTLVQVETQGSQIQMQQMEAEQAALLGLQIALGELQKAAGPDTRVTAPADILDADGPRQLTGVWRSWEGLDHDSASGFPGYGKLPDYEIKSENFDENKPEEGRFLGWLISQDPKDSSSPAPDTDVAPSLTKTSQTVPLISSKTIGENAKADEVHLEPVLVKAGKAAYAWWIGGENTKANLSAPEPQPNTNEGWDQRMASAGQADATYFDIDEPEELGKVASRRNLDLLTSSASAADSVSGQNFHDLTVNSRGLLTNTATGGWRRDLSLMSEQWSTLPNTGLPFFTIEPGRETRASKANGDSRPQSFLLYPWSIVRGKQKAPGNHWFFQTNPVSSWSALQDFCVNYKDISSGDDSGNVTMPRALPKVHGVSTGDTLTTSRDITHRYPTLARIHWVFSYSSKLNPAQLGASDAYIACIVATPVVTVWNPYNVSLTVNNYGIRDTAISPIRFKLTVGSKTYQKMDMLTIINSGARDVDRTYDYAALPNQGIVWIRLREKGGSTSVTFAPGEAKVFSIGSTTFEDVAHNNNGETNLVLEPGYRTEGGLRYELWESAIGVQAERPIVGSAADVFRAEELSFDRGYAKNSRDGSSTGFYLDLNSDNTWYGTYRLNTGIANAEQYWPAITPVANNNKTLGDSEVVDRASAFCSSIYGPSICTESDRVAKGTLQRAPVCFYNGVGWRTETNAVRKGAGNDNPANWSYDYQFFELNNWNDPGCPSGTSSESTAYFGPSFSANGGLNRMTMVDLPLRPLASLAELQHFDLLKNTACHPYQLNVIGNSHAHPLIKPEKTYVETSDAGVTGPHQYDHSYVANHLLFDDWFISSIAPDTNAYLATEARALSKVYEDHLSGAISLPNHNYLPANQVPLEQASTVGIEHLTDTTKSGLGAWYHIASKLEVQGMFNINSTSVEAWKAMLRHLKDAEIPYLDESGAISLESGSGNPISRSSVASEALAGGGINSSGLFTEANEFTGYRRFTDNQIDALANQIVIEIKERGPFLSLSEFINRRLVSGSSNQDLARAGVIEAALLKLSEGGGGSANPYATLQSRSIEITDGNLPDNTAAYEFPYAAKGYTSYGYPGWTRQADVLRPLAPILSARDDTFVIRCYGDARNLTGDVTAKAWVEAVVKRTANFVDLSDDSIDFPVKSVNQEFGRRFSIISIRWLSKDEV